MFLREWGVVTGEEWGVLTPEGVLTRRGVVSPEKGGVLTGEGGEGCSHRTGGRDNTFVGPSLEQVRFYPL